MRRGLETWLADEARRLDGTVRLLDVGCGLLPYAAVFAPYVAEHVGLDFDANPLAQLHGSAEALPVEDASFDVVLCTQVLEHCDQPAAVVAELRRVTRPGGRVLASTHGVYPYHPAPVDNWRWTHTGLELLFTRNARWSAVTVMPATGTAACLGMLASWYIQLAAKRVNAAPLVRPLVAAINLCAAALDAADPSLREPLPGALIANYHVIAEV